MAALIEGILIEPPTYGELEVEALLLGTELFAAKMRHESLLASKDEAEKGLDEAERTGDAYAWSRYLLVFHQADDVLEAAKADRDRAYRAWASAHRRLRQVER